MFLTSAILVSTFHRSLNSFLGRYVEDPTGNKDLNGYRLFGTSAAAPNVAAVAALLRQAIPEISPLSIYQVLEESAIDMMGEGFDFESGYGLVSALAAVDSVMMEDKEKDDDRPTNSPTRKPGNNKKKKARKKKAKKDDDDVDTLPPAGDSSSANRLPPHCVFTNSTTFGNRALDEDGYDGDEVLVGVSSVRGSITTKMKGKK